MFDQEEAARRRPGVLARIRGVGSPQTLSQADRRIVARWAADCAERALWLFEAEAPGDSRPRDAIARARAFARGELDVAEEIRRRFIAGATARAVATPSAVAAAKAAGQAAAVPHMGAHALGAAAYAAKAAGLAGSHPSRAVADEIQWQLNHMSAEARTALRKLPPVGENRSGPLGPGLLASGLLGTIIHDLQAGFVRVRDGTTASAVIVRVHGPRRKSDRGAYGAG
jgi:immunity protein 5 of polymorphic toxin system